MLLRVFVAFSFFSCWGFLLCRMGTFLSHNASACLYPVIVSLSAPFIRDFSLFFRPPGLPRWSFLIFRPGPDVVPFPPQPHPLWLPHGDIQRIFRFRLTDKYITEIGFVSFEQLFDVIFHGLGVRGGKVVG